MTRLNRWLGLAAKRSDLVVIVLIISAILMMILPLPTVLVDVLIAISITFSLLVLVVALYITEPVEFSTLPSVILLGTLFRLALSITTTRLILVQANAGDIVAAFGEFVVSGQVVVGLVVFLIITVAQFVVITKGSERVAEVAARFTLDALPGKQMSIDNEARNGDISQEQAKAKRRLLERESQFYGAMDGAMKFVKGDAVAGLIIIAVNLIGGLLVGVWQQGMPFADAANTYSLLTVGDGLIAQIPSLMISVAAGTVVTRVTSHENKNLGSEVAFQLGSDSRVLALSSAILCALSLVPGFPAPIFVTLAAATGGLALLARRKDRSAQITEESVSPESAAQGGPDIGSARLVLCIADDRPHLLPRAAFEEQSRTIRQQIFSDLGVNVPPIGFRTEAGFGDKFCLEFDGIPIRDGEIPDNFVWIKGAPANLDLLGIPYTSGEDLIDSDPTVIVDAQYAHRLAEAHIAFHSADMVLLDIVSACARQYASQFLGFQETRNLLSSVESEFGELVKEAISASSLQKVSEILRRLLEENVPIINLRTILEAIVEWGPHITNAHGLVEYARVALARQICHQAAGEKRVIAAYILTRQAEEAVRSALQDSQHMPDAVSRPIVDQIVAAHRSADPKFKRAVLTSMDIRRPIRGLLVRHNIDLPVLSYQEIAPEFRVQALSSISHQPRLRTSHFQPGEDAQSAA